MNAIRAPSVGNPTIETVPKPSLSKNADNNIALVRVTHVANNPSDVFFSTMPSFWNPENILGCDFAGVIAACNQDQHGHKPGDIVYGVVAAGAATDHSRGAFAELVPAYPDFLFPIPQDRTPAEMATVGVALLTVETSLFDVLRLPFPEHEEQWSCGRSRHFLVHGASTTTGMMLTQWLKLAGFRVIGTASPHNFELVKARGVENVVDYKDREACIAQIRDIVGNDLEFVYTCVRDDLGAELADKLLTTGGRYLAIASGAMPTRSDIQAHFIRGQSGVAYEYHGNEGITKQTPEQRLLAIRAFKLAGKWFAEGKLFPPPIDLRSGLEGALHGIRALQMGTVSGRKIVSQL